MLKPENLVLCHMCKAEIELKNTGNYCTKCREIIEYKVDKNAARKKWRDKNKEKIKAYNASIKEKRREYDRLRYEERKKNANKN